MGHIALLFPGQGSQYIKMGKQLTETFPVAAEVFEEANDALGRDLKEIIFNGTLQEITQSENAQPAVVTLSYAFYRVYMQEIGILPRYAAGHSLGEISALIAAGGMTFSQGVVFAEKRGAFMQEAYTEKIGSMGLVMNVDEETVEDMAGTVSRETGYVVISGYNTPRQILVSGLKEGVKTLGKAVNRTGGEFIPFSMVAMKVNAPFHSALMENVKANITAELRKITFQPLKFPVISNVYAAPYDQTDDIVDNLSLQMISPVRWRQTISFMEEQYVTHLFEIGPQKVLKNMIPEISPRLSCFSMDSPEDFKNMYRLFFIDQKSRADKISTCLKIASGTRNYGSHDDETYKTGVVLPFRKIKDLLYSREDENADISINDVVQCIQLLMTILDTKKIPHTEREQIMDELFSGTEQHVPELAELIAEDKDEVCEVQI